MSRATYVISMSLCSNMTRRISEENMANGPLSSVRQISDIDKIVGGFEGEV